MKKFEKAIMGKTITATAKEELEPQVEILFTILEQIEEKEFITTLWNRLREESIMN